MARWSVGRVWVAHWNGLNNRKYTPDGDLVETPDLPARALSIGLPVTTAVLVAVGWQAAHGTSGLGVDGTSIAVVAAVLASTGLLAVFARLAAWRDRLRDRNKPREQPLRGLVDESVAHVLAATLEAVLLIPTAVVGSLASGWVGIAVAGVVVGSGAHVVFLLVLIVGRLWSAYDQVNRVSEGREEALL